MTTLLAIDPCAEREVSTTGWVFGSYSDDKPFTLLDGGVVEGGFKGLCDTLQLRFVSTHPLMDALVEDADEVVVERFVLYNKAADPAPMLAEGMIRYLRPDAVLQPSSVMQYVTDGHLKALGLYRTEGNHRDFNSALKHALAYLRNRYHRPTLQQLTFSRN